MHALLSIREDTVGETLSEERDRNTISDFTKNPFLGVDLRPQEK